MRGAGIGAAAGGGAQAATKSQPIQLTAETVINFTLQSPITVTLVEKDPDSDRRKLDVPH
jgi:hypothetical protein